MNSLLEFFDTVLPFLLAGFAFGVAFCFCLAPNQATITVAMAGMSTVMSWFMSIFTMRILWKMWRHGKSDIVTREPMRDGGSAGARMGGTSEVKPRQHPND